MITKPLVSVFITTYNHDAFISDLLESILTQNYENFEIIVGDDASTDKSQEILLEYRVKYPNIIKLVLHEKNIGVTNNCNSVLLLCSGQYITTMSGDDQMLPDKLSIQAEYLESNENCNMCFHNMEAFDSETNNLLYYTHFDGHGKRKRDSGTIKDAIKEGVFFSPSSVMFRAINTPQGGFDVRIPVASDWLFYVDVLSKGGSVEYLDHILGRYRRGSNNITINRPAGFFLEVDLMNSINIIMIRYPEYTKEALYRYGTMLFKMRKINYFIFVTSSLRLDFRLKGFIALIIYVISVGRIKL